MASRGMPVTEQIRSEKRKRAEARQAEYDKLTLQQKIERLPANGAMKQRAKLLALLDKQQNKKTPEAEVSEKIEAAERVIKQVKKNKKGNEQ